MTFSHNTMRHKRSSKAQQLVQSIVLPHPHVLILQQIIPYNKADTVTHWSTGFAAVLQHICIHKLAIPSLKL